LPNTCTHTPPHTHTHEQTLAMDMKFTTISFQLHLFVSRIKISKPYCNNVHIYKNAPCLDNYGHLSDWLTRQPIYLATRITVRYVDCTNPKRHKWRKHVLVYVLFDRSGSGQPKGELSNGAYLRREQLVGFLLQTHLPPQTARGRLRGPGTRVVASRTPLLNASAACIESNKIHWLVGQRLQQRRSLSHVADRPLSGACVATSATTTRSVRLCVHITSSSYRLADRSGCQRRPDQFTSPPLSKHRLSPPRPVVGITSRPAVTCRMRRSPPYWTERTRFNPERRWAAGSGRLQVKPDDDQMAR